AHGRDPKTESLSGPRPYGDLPDRRFYGNDRRSVGQERNAAAADPRRGESERRDLQAADVQAARSGEDGTAVQRRVDGQIRRGGFCKTLCAYDGKADPRTR